MMADARSQAGLLQARCQFGEENQAGPTVCKESGVL